MFNTLQAFIKKENIIEFSRSKANNFLFHKIIAIGFLLGLGSFSSSAIPILGPKGESPTPIQRSEPKIIENINNVNTTTINQTQIKRRIIGPTTQKSTLWGIASKNTPRGLSIYQTIGAIYKLNPLAFENGNIHNLIPGSLLLLPTPKEIKIEQIELVSNKLARDQKLLDEIESNQRKLAQKPKVSTSKTVSTKAVVKDPITKVNSADVEQKEVVKIQKQENPSPEIKKEEIVSSSQELDTSSMLALATPTEKPQNISQEELDSINSQMTKLIENNHILKIRLAETQNELKAINEKLAKSEPLNSEISQFLEAERMKEQEAKKMEPSLFQTISEKTWLLLMLAVLPALIVLSAIFFFIRKHSQNKEANDPSLLSSQTINSLDKELNTLNIKDADVELITLPDDDEDEDVDLDQDINADDLFNDEILLEDDDDSEQGSSATKDEKQDSNTENKSEKNVENKDPEEPQEKNIKNENLDKDENSESESQTPEDLSVEISENQVIQTETDDLLGIDSPDEPSFIDLDELESQIAAASENKPEILDEIVEDNASSSDEDLAAQWEQSLIDDTKTDKDAENLEDDKVSAQNSATDAKQTQNKVEEKSLSPDELLAAQWEQSLTDETKTDIDAENPEDDKASAQNSATDAKQTQDKVEEKPLSPDELLAAQWEQSLTDETKTDIDAEKQEDDKALTQIGTGDEKQTQDKVEEKALSPDELLAAQWEQSLSSTEEKDEASKPDLLENTTDEQTSKGSSNTKNLEEQNIEQNSESKEQQAIDKSDLNDVGSVDSEKKSSQMKEDKTDLEQVTQNSLANEVEVSTSLELDNKADKTEQPQDKEKLIEEVKDPEGTLDLSDFPEFDEEAVLDDLHDLLNEDATSTSLETDNKNLSQLSFPEVDKVDFSELGEFEEDDAFNAALAEQKELEDFEIPQIELSDDEIDEEYKLVAGLNMDALLSESENDDFTALTAQDLDIELDNNEKNTKPTNVQNSSDQDDDFFNEDDGIWINNLDDEPELESEDWSEQPELQEGDLELLKRNQSINFVDDDEINSELLETSSIQQNEDSDININDLMQGSQLVSEQKKSSENAEIDFTKFAENTTEIEVSNTEDEVIDQMDLAKAYIEMNDKEAALPILKKMSESIDKKTKKEALALLKKLDKA